MPTPHITIEQISAIQPGLTNTTVVAECNRCNVLIDAHNKALKPTAAEANAQQAHHCPRSHPHENMDSGCQSITNILMRTRLDEMPIAKQQETYSNAGEARKAGAGNAEYLDEDNKWRVCSSSCKYRDCHQYRAIQPQAQPEPVDEQLYCMVSKDGEPAIRMLGTEAQKSQAELGDTVEWKVKHGEFNAVAGNLSFAYTGTYTYRTKPAKVVLLADVPLGVAVVVKEDKRVGRVISVLVDKISTISIEVIFGGGDTEAEIEAFFEGDLELAPASAQPWIAAQDDQNREELILDFGKAGLCYEFDVYRYKITGLAEGYVLEGAKPTGVLTK